MTIHDRAAMLMEPISEIDENTFDEANNLPTTPPTTTSNVDREHGDIIKVKNVCKCNWYQIDVVKINWMHLCIIPPSFCYFKLFINLAGTQTSSGVR